MKKSEIRKQVQEFMEAAGQEVKESPEVPSDDVVRLRAKLVMEEAFELLEAMFDEPVERLKHEVMELISGSDIDINMVEVADACADIDYVVEGARLAFGINGKPIADEVQRTNMAKFGEGSWVREDGKRMKPPGWKPPDIGKLLKEQKDE